MKTKLFILLAISLMAFILVFIYSSDTEFTLSHSSGFYSEPFYLEMSVPLGATAYYTLDGSTPTEASTAYSGPIYIDDATNNPNVYSSRTDMSVMTTNDFDIDYDNTIYPKPEIPDFPVDKCTVLRAVCINSFGKVIANKTASYFVDYNNKNGYENVGIVSVVTDPSNLFDYENGILVTGKYYDEGPKENWNNTDANYRQKGIDWERKAYVEFFDSSHSKQLSKDCGIRIQGNYGRSLYSKSFRIYARDIYDKDNHFEYDFFGNSYFAKTLTLFSGSQDCKTLLRDRMIQDLLRDKVNVATMHYVPYVMFLDGEYWGVHYLCETYEDEYFEHYYGIDEKDVIVVKDGLDVGDIEKDTLALSEMAEYAFKVKDYDNADSYKDVSSRFDLSNVADYFALEIYIGRCHDWPTGNISTWASRNISDKRYSDQKWRYVLFDLYYDSMSESAAGQNTYDWVKKNSPLFYSLTRTRDFRDMLADSISTISNEYLSDEMVDTYIDNYVTDMKEPILKHYLRFYGDNLSEEDFDDAINEIRSFMHSRHEYADKLIDELHGEPTPDDVPDYSMFDVLFE